MRFINLAVIATFAFSLNANTLQTKQVNLEKPIVKPDNADSNDELDKLQYPWVGIITQIRGKTIINRFTNEGEKRLSTFTAELGLVIHEKDELTTGNDSLVTIKLKNKTIMHLAPNSVFKIYKHYTDTKNNQSSLFNLLFGGVRASVEKLLPDSSVRLYTNNATIGVRGTEFVVDYSPDEKETKIACFDGEVEVTPSMTNESSINSTNYANVTTIKAGEFAKVDTVRDEKGTTPIVSEKKQLSDKVEGSIKNTFTSDKIKPDDWDFARINSSFFRFNIGYELIIAEIAEGHKYSAIHLEWSPLFNIYSFIYLEPFIGVGALKFDTYYLKTGANLVFSIWHGLNLGFGGGLAGGIAKPGLNYGYSGYFPMLDFLVNYTFLDKKLGFIDGVSLIYNHSTRTNTYPPFNSLEIGLILNFSNGREKW